MGKYSCLENSELTRSWSLETRAALAYFLEKQELKAGVELFVPQHEEQKIYFLEIGQIKAKNANSEVEFGPGKTLGELSLFSRTKKQLSVTASTDCLFWVLTKEKWDLLWKNAEDLAAKLRESVQQKFARELENCGPLRL